MIEYAANDLIKLFLACWNSIEFSGPNLVVKYSYNPLTASLPNISLDTEFGNTSITPHPGAGGNHTIRVYI